MPIILTSEDVQPFVTFFGSTIVETAGVISQIGDTTFAGNTTVEILPVGGFPVLTFSGSTVFQTLGSAPQLGQVIFTGKTTVETQGEVPNTDVFFLNLTVDIIPQISASFLWLPRLKVKGIEIPIVDGIYSERSDSSGASLQVQLARQSDRIVVTEGSSVEFGIGRKVSGVWEESSFITLLDEGIVEGSSYAISWDDNRPIDRINMRSSSGLNERLSKTPENGVIFYDSSRITLNQSDFEPLVDTEARQYPVELKPISGLTLHDLLNEVFVVRSTFVAVKTNITNHSLSRVDCSIGRTYIESIRGQLGMFDPVIFEQDNEVWIVDTTMTLPAGFPPAKILGTSNYRTLSTDSSKSRLDGFIVSYVEDAREFDYITTRTVTATETTGTSGQSDYTSTFIQRFYRQYRKFSNPGVVLREELYHEERFTRDSFNDISEIREDFLFDSQSRFYNRSKTTHARVPDVENGGLMTLRQVADETETLAYSSHPFRPRAQYVQRRELKTSGLIVVDADNEQLGQSFEREYLQSFRSGNLAEGQSTRFGAIRTVTEDAEPQRNGQIKIKAYEVDHLSKVVVRDESEERPGDISISGLSPETNQVLVFDNENTTRTTDRLESINAGELPLIQVIPWARRKLLARKTKSRTIEVPVIGYDRGIRRGMPVRILGRSGEFIGNFIVLGRSVSFGQEGVITELTCKEI